MTERLLDVRGLTVEFTTDDGPVRAVDDVDLTLDRGRMLAIVGESGSGKSVTAQTLIGLTRGHRTRIDGAVNFKGADLLHASEVELRRVRGREIAMIFQDPMTSLNPVKRVGAQIVEAIRAHDPVSRREARRRAADLLGQVGIARSRERLDDYPHRFSGGMRQRVMIAIAMSCNPDVLIADEPTTALDVTIQAQIFEVLGRVRKEFDSAIILITHDLALAASVADTAMVMYAGRVVERGAVADVFEDPQHPYTWGLIGSIPRLDRPRPRRLYSISGLPPKHGSGAAECRFRERCPHRFERCADEPPLQPRVGTEHADRCWLSPQQRAQLRPADIVAVAP